MIKEFIIQNKKYIILILIMVIYGGIVILINENNKKNKGIITTNSSQFIISNNKIEVVNKKNFISWKKFDIYEDTSYLGNYYLQYNDIWRIYDDFRNPIKIYGNIIAFNNVKHDVIEYDRTSPNLDEQNKIKEFLRKYDIQNDYPIIINKIEEKNNNLKIYEIKSEPNSGYDYMVNGLLYEENNNIKEIIKISKDKKLKNLNQYSIYGIVDINKDDKIEILVTKQIYSKPDETCEMIFRKESKKYNQITKCEN